KSEEIIRFKNIVVRNDSTALQRSCIIPYWWIKLLSRSGELQGRQSTVSNFRWACPPFLQHPFLPEKKVAPTKNNSVHTASNLHEINCVSLISQYTPFPKDGFHLCESSDDPKITGA